MWEEAEDATQEVDASQPVQDPKGGWLSFSKWLHSNYNQLTQENRETQKDSVSSVLRPSKSKSRNKTLALTYHI